MHVLNIPRQLVGATAPTRAAARTVTFVLKVLPMLPSRPLNWVTPSPVIEQVRYPSENGDVTGDLYRPSRRGPHPGLVVCLGVVPFGVDHPQVARLGEALARSGFAALLYWSPTMRDTRLHPDDARDIARAFEWLIDQPYVDAHRSGLLGTCVGGAFALLAAAVPAIRDRVAFVFAFAPYASMWTLARDIASGTCVRGERREPWAVDPLTHEVFLRSITSELAPAEAARLRAAFLEGQVELDDPTLSAESRAVVRLLAAASADEAALALGALPDAMRQRLAALSPLSCLADVRAPLIAFAHDRDDQVIPVSESRQLAAALAGRAGVRYTEFAFFQHVAPRRLPPIALVRELGKFLRALYPMFRVTSGGYTSQR